MAVLEKVRTEGKFTIAGNTTSDPIEVFDDIAVMVVTVSFPQGSGQGKLQASTSTNRDLENGNGVWVDWPEGSVTATTQDWMQAPNGLRIVNESTEDMLVEIRGNYA